MLRELNNNLRTALGSLASDCNGYFITDKGITLQFKKPVSVADLAKRLGVEFFQVMVSGGNEYIVFDD